MKHLCFTVAMLIVTVLPGGFSAGKGSTEPPPLKVHTNYYNVQGSSIEELKESIRQNGPRDQYGKRRDAAVHWHIWWEWPEVGGQPDFEHTKASYKLTLTMPHLSAQSSIPPEALQSWERYLKSIIAHERQHIRHVEENLPRIEQEIRAAARKDAGLTAKAAHAIGSKILYRISELDYQYDRKTDHGQREGVVLGPGQT